jgi:hypothetical protein
MGIRKLSFIFALFAMLGVAEAQAQFNTRVNEYQVRTLLQRIETRTDAFRTSAGRRLDNSNLNNTRAEDNISALLDAFERSTDQLTSNFNSRNATEQNVRDVLTYGAYVDNFMQRNRMGAASENQWNLIRQDLDQLAQLYRVSWNWNQTLPPFQAGQWNGGGAAIRINETQFRNIVRRIETRTDTFRAAADRRMDNSRLDGTRAEDNIAAYLNAFENATDELSREFNSGRATSADVNDVLTYGAYVDGFVRRRNMGAAVTRQWNLIRSDLDQLSRLYQVSWNWNQTLPPFPMDRWGGNTGGGMSNSRLDGTYRLNASQSDDVAAVLNRVTYNSTMRDRQRQNLERRLNAPQSIAIETRGNVITMATDFGSQVTLTADGRAITETNNRGRSTTTRVTMNGNTLTIQTQGDRNNDYTVTFTPVAQNRLRVTRSLYLENQNQTVTATAVYDRTADTANWPPVNTRPDYGSPVGTGEFYIPSGTRLTAVLRNRIATDASYAGDPFSMEVTSPGQFSGAIIRGRLSSVNTSGRVSGRANLSMEFDTIQYRGQTYRFAGIIDSAREADGDTININNEGTVRDSNQTTRTVTRAGIGAALGALIGAIAGGGDGAAIGAAVGAGAGAGSVLIQGRNNLQLESGTEFTITSTGPTTVGYRY